MSIDTQFGAELKIDGQETAADAKSKVQALRAAILELKEGFDLGEIGPKEFSATLRALNTDLRAAQQSARIGAEEELRSATSYRIADEAIKKHGSTQAATAALTEKASTATRGAQERTRGLAYAMNDFFAVSGGVQQRLNAIANNLPQLFAGLSPKLLNFGLALGAIAPIIGVIIANWDTLGKKIEEVLGIAGSEKWEAIKKGIVDAFEGAVKDAVPHLEGLKTKIKELEDKPHKIDIDYIDLQHAREEAEKIAEGLRVIDQLKKHQTKAEKESGGLVTEAVTSAQGGPEKFLADLTEQFRRELMATRENRPGALGVTDRKIKEKETQLRTEHAADFGGDKEALENYIRQNRDLRTLERKRTEQEADISRPGGLAETEAGKAIAAARDKHGPDQAKAQADLAKRARRAGHGEVAEQLESAPELEAYDKEAKGFEQKMDKAHAAGEARRRAAEALKKKRDTALGDIAKSDVQDPMDDTAAKWANATSKDLEESFDKLKKHIAVNLTRRLQNRGISAEGGADAIDKTAATLADQALDRVGKLPARQAKATAAAAKKEATAAAKDIDAIAKQEIKSGKADAKDEVKLIEARVGDEYQERYEAAVANNAAFAAQGGAVAHSKAEEAKLKKQGVEYSLPEEEAKKRLQAQIQADLRQRGATPQAAQQATKQITDKGDVALQKELGEAQGNNQQRLMQVASMHNATLAALINRQAQQGQDIQGLLANASRAQRMVTSNAPSASNSGSSVQ